MNNEVYKKIESYISKYDYDSIIKIIEKNHNKITLSSYNDICKNIVGILNRNKINRDVNLQDELQAYEEFFANRFYEIMYRNIKKNNKGIEPDESVLNDLKKYYHDILDINSLSVFYNDEGCDNYEKTK